MFFPRVQSRN
uniref:Uncharacterized protein n=1 Tax=Rhizophora mucronata TaxID=61149 RepID=A0A2P2P7I3_RHIMU